MTIQWKKPHSPVGLRTLKTAAAVTASIVLVEQYGTSADELLFGVMGTFSAMEPTFKGSVRGCISQFMGVLMGVLLSLALRPLDVPGAVAAGIGIVLVMACYQILRLRSSPVLPCLILVTICTDPGLNAVVYGLERLWNTTLGMAAGMVINMIIFPYDNGKKLRQIMDSLDGDLIRFLEDMFDGDDHLPDPEGMERKLDTLEAGLTVFSDQRLLIHPRRHRRLIARYQSCEGTVRALLREVEVLHSIRNTGRLNRENRKALRALGANIPDARPDNRFSVEDLVINYHVARALELREQLKKELSGNEKG